MVDVQADTPALGAAEPSVLLPLQENTLPPGFAWAAGT